jgi:putative tryptophan/tyrosine transport system substrate-binding protein
MRRRKFITLLGGMAAVWPLAARAQQAGRMKRIGVLMGLTVDDPEGQARRAAFQHRLEELGWTVDRDVEIDYRWGGANPESIHKSAAELVALAPDVILATSGATVGALQQASRAVPIVFAGVIDPVGSGFVDSLARPGGNATGFLVFEYSLSGKWVELLKQIAPSVTRAAVLRDTANPAGNAQFSAIQTVAQSLGVEVSPLNMRDTSEIERGVAAFGRSSNSGLIVTASPTITIFRNLIISLANKYRLPTVYPFRFFVTDGGLISYGPDFIDQYRRAAGYVDRILKGEKPSDMPVQAPTKYELVINLKTAKALGLELPSTLLSRADEVIE